MSFLKNDINNAKTLWDDCINKSFIQELKNGDLKESKFINFLIQDVLYLKAHAKVYGKALFISETLEDYRVFHSVLGVIDNSEDSIQWNYIHHYNLTDEYISNTPAKPETQESIYFIMKIAYQDDIRKILVAILPCLLSYSYIFQRLDKDPKSKESPYANLINNYASESYKESCDYWVEYTERKCANATEQEELDNEINEQRLAQGKKPLKNKKKEEYKTKKVSTTDPEAGYYVKGEREKQFAYSLHACVDKNGYIIDKHVTPGNIHDSTQLKPMIERLEAKQMLPITLAIDSGYKTPFNAHFLLEKAIVPAMPYTRPKGKPGFFRTKDFIYDEYYDTYICPNDEILSYKRTMPTGHRLYVSDGSICRDCPVLSKCTENKDAIKQIRRHVWQDDLDIVEDLRFIDTVKKQYKLRSQTIERRFGDAKEQHGMRWTRYRGHDKVSMDTTLICAAMNLKK